MKKISIILLIATLAMGSSQLTNKSHDLKFMSFNIRNGSEWAEREDGENAWSHRKEAVVEMIRKEAPDAIGMQEVLPHQLDYLDSALAGEYKSFGVGRDDGRREGEIMCIFYRTDRLELLEQKTYWLSDTPRTVSLGWDAACRRTVTVGLFRDKLTDSLFVYFNTHLDHVGSLARKSSVKLLCTLALPYHVPCVMGGDMNSSLQDKIFDPMEMHDLTSARDLAEISDSATTYNAFGKGTPAQIDHFFVRGWSKVKSFRTLTDDYGVPYISDHYPVVTVLSF